MVVRRCSCWLTLIASLLPACSEDTTIRRDAGHADDGHVDGDGDGDGDNGSEDDAGAERPAQLADGVAGEPCRDAAQCEGENAECATTLGGIAGIGGTGAPGGYCTATCDDDSQCGEGGVCVGLGQRQCRRACDEDRDCDREGYVCSEGLGLPGTNAPSTCMPAPDTVEIRDGFVGDPCRFDLQCGGGTCSDTLGAFELFGQSLGGTPAPGGYCSGPCTEDAQCGSDGLCVKLIPFGSSAGSCYLACGSACSRPGYACAPVVVGVGGQGNDVPEACVPERVQDEDAGVPDAGASDAGASDAGTPDAGTPDAGSPDAGGLDAGALDAGLLDPGASDAASPDADHAKDAGSAS